MISVIQDGSNMKIFECRDSSDICRGLSILGQTHDVNVIFICDTADRVQAIIANEDYKIDFDYEIDKAYKLYGTNAYSTNLLPLKNDMIGSSQWTVGPMPFVISEIRTPRPVSEVVRA